uniref:Uncharacterized protein n=1 Tax=viral metagenome TaxID=1070528 RepID=A0A6C0C8U5_9ZZZZ
MLSICTDILYLIGKHLSEKEKIKWLSICTDTNKLKNKFIYNTKVSLNKILNLSYRHNFSHVSHITLDAKVPDCVTHLEYKYFFNSPIKGCIPSSVKYLEFGFKFNQSIEGCIPLSVTHLTFGYEFQQSIKGNIPLSVTHLDVARYNKTMGQMPSSVTHLRLAYLREENVDFIPSSVTHLTFTDNLREKGSIAIPKTVKYVKWQ